MSVFSRIVGMVNALALSGCAVAVMIGYSVTWDDVAVLVLLGGAAGWLESTS